MHLPLEVWRARDDRRRSRMRSMSSLLVSILVMGWGPIAAPPEAIDLRENPAALQEDFDRQHGVPRLVLLLSPA